jgi:iron complex outermembrane receptor protein
LQNVGAIDNSGWELQATSSLGALSVTASMSLVDSRVARLASGYLGDLREGDRMLEVPRRTVGVQTAWTTGRWMLTGSLSRASDWVNYDEIALAQAIAADPTGRLTPVGPALRAYWRGYDGATHVGLGGTVRVSDGTSLMLTGANLLNRQLGEPDNVTVLPGRSVILGVRTNFR